MQSLPRPELDQEQSRVLLTAHDLAWRRIIEAQLLDPTEHVRAQNILYDYILHLLRRGERKESRLARRGIFLICGLLASPQCAYVPGRPLMANGTQIVF